MNTTKFPTHKVGQQQQETAKQATAVAPAATTTTTRWCVCSEVYYNNKRLCMRVCAPVCKIHKKKSQKSRELGGRQFCNCVSLFMHELCVCSVYVRV